MRVSREQADANRERVVEIAGRLFRERGFDAVSIGDLMKEAGLTHGGFYRQFDSKEALIREVCLRGASESVAAVHADDGPSAYIEEFLDAYLSTRHRDDPMTGCTVAALSGDAGHGPRELQEVFATGIGGMATALSQATADSEETEPDFPALATMVGALVLARAVKDADPAMSEAILQTAKNALVEQGVLPH
jgi:TetR/AcrR family transcriptional repressor of nem operon